jgi:acetoin utilization deacetylase AcuC-like enzyme
MRILFDWKLHLKVETCNARRLERKDFYRAHNREYVDDVLALRKDTGFQNRSEVIASTLKYTTASLYSAARYCIVNSVSNAGSLALDFSHAGYDFGANGCTFNGLVIAAAKLREENLAAKIGILDLSKLFGAGTKSIVDHLGLNYITHYSSDIDCPSPTEIAELLRKDFKDCDIILYQSTARDDLSIEQLRLRDEAVFKTAIALGVPIAWTTGSGYEQSDISETLEKHRSTARLALRSLMDSRFRKNFFKRRDRTSLVECAKRIHARRVRFSERDLKILRNYCLSIERDTGVRPSVSWIILELLSLGLKEFEKNHIHHTDLIDGVMSTMFDI